MEAILTVLAVSLGVSLGFISLITYLIATPGGLLERLVKASTERNSTHQKSIDNFRASLKDLEKDVRIINETVDTKVQLLTNRITSFETKYGKRSKKEEQEELQNMIFSQTQPQLNKGNNA